MVRLTYDQILCRVIAFALPLRVRSWGRWQIESRLLQLDVAFIKGRVAASRVRIKLGAKEAKICLLNQWSYLPKIANHRCVSQIRHQILKTLCIVNHMEDGDLLSHCSRTKRLSFFNKTLRKVYVVIFVVDFTTSPNHHIYLWWFSPQVQITTNTCGENHCKSKSPQILSPQVFVGMIFFRLRIRIIDCICN